MRVSLRLGVVFVLAVMSLELSAGQGRIPPFLRRPAEASTYSLPNDDNGCPAECRQISWLAGADVWNGNGTPGGGSLPNWTGVPCSAGLTEGDGTTDNTTAIEACLAAISANQASVLPCGMFYVNGKLDIPSSKVLRGCGSGFAGGPCAQGGFLSTTFHGDTVAGGSPACTTLKLGPSGWIKGNGSSSLGSISNLASGYTKGSTTLVCSSACTGIATGDWIIVSELEDSEIPSSIKSHEYAASADECTWCGEANATSRPMTQIVQVANISGTTITTSRPMYYTFKSALTPRIRELSNIGTKTGVENLKIWGSSTSRSEAMLDFEGSALCWVRGVEAYDVPDVGKAWHVKLYYSYGCEIRDSYLHFGRGNSGDRNYSPGLFGPTSDNKIENVVMRENRHAMTQEAGGSGNVFLYNYVDDQYTDDLSYLGSGRMNHGAHPYMNLAEGNVFSHYTVDGYWGTSSHGVFFRNWFWGDATGNYTGWSNVGSGTPDYGFTAVEVSTQQHYYAFVGNLLGRPDNLHANWNNATLLPTSCGANPTRSTPVVFYLGCLGNYDTPGSGNGFSAGRDSLVRSTMILHGNYDYKTDGVAHWDGGSNHTLPSGMYYTSKPSFLGSCQWPAFGPEPTLTTIPAVEAYEAIASVTITSASC